MRSDLSSICYYAKEKVPLSELSKHNYVSTENLKSNKEGLGDASSLPAVTQTQRYKKGDTLVSNIRPYFKKIWYAQNDGGCSNDICVLRAKEGVDPLFLYYVLADDAFFTYATATSKGTKMPRGDKAAIMRYEVPIIDIGTQRKIAEILGNLDYKIELNTKINQNLEEQARLIFKKYFIDNKYQAGKQTSIGSICSCELGGTPSRSKPEYWNGNIPWINSGEINRFRIISPSEFITAEGLDHSATKLLPPKTTVIAITGATLGQVSLLEIESCANQSVVGIIPNEKLPYEFIYPFIQTNMKELISHQTGGAQQHINTKDVEGLPILLPTSTVLKEYCTLVTPLYTTIAQKCFESERLMQLRETLLPKLMSGELDISNIDI